VNNFLCNKNDAQRNARLYGRLRDVHKAEGGRTERDAVGQSKGCDGGHDAPPAPNE